MHWLYLAGAIVIDRLRFFSPRTPESATYYAYYRSLPPTPIVALRAADAVAATAAVRYALVTLSRSLTRHRPYAAIDRTTIAARRGLSPYQRTSADRPTARGCPTSPSVDSPA